MSNISDDKVIHLSHVILKKMESLPGAAFPRGSNTARLRALAVIQEAVKAEDALQERLRQKIAAMKRPPPEGSREWEILFRRYYDEEMLKLGPPR